MNMWEYKTINGIPSNNLLNRMGLEGWELCGVCNIPYTAPEFYFKRKLQHKTKLIRTEKDENGTDKGTESTSD